MKHIIIGTAGHVDHGKTALIKALTGVDTDRLAEEKRRGISIDLGFASLALAADLQAGVVDVPGHERFLKNMLAGSGGIDVALLVVAADEGVMPQTREHLAMLQLFGAPCGVIAVTKADKADGEWRELVEQEVRQLTAGTFLAAAPLLFVSAFSGEGLEELRAALEAAARSVPPRDSEAPFRLWVDRAFSVRGHGTVVTGTVLSGAVAPGQVLQWWPAQQEVRVRGVESHGQALPRVAAGQRGALNLGGLEAGLLGRGQVLSGPERLLAACRWDVSLRWHEGEAAPGTRVRLHLGTGEWLGRLWALPEPAAGSLWRLVLEQPLCAAPGDRGIVRLYSPPRLLGGVQLVAPAARRGCPPERPVQAAALAAGDAAAYVASLLREDGAVWTEQELRRRCPYWRDGAIRAALAQPGVCRLGGGYAWEAALQRRRQGLLDFVAAYHRRHPDRPGPSREEARQHLAASRGEEALLAQLLAAGALVASGGEVALPGHAAGSRQRREEALLLLERRLEPGRLWLEEEELAALLGLEGTPLKAVVEGLLRDGELVRLQGMYVYRKTMQNILLRLQAHFQRHDTLSVAQLRDELNTSRKFALPLAEYLDLHKYTVRRGDLRAATQKIRDLSEKSFF